MDYQLVTPSGTTLSIDHRYCRDAPSSDATELGVTVQSSSGVAQYVSVTLELPGLIHAALQQHLGFPLNDQNMKDLAVIAVIDEIDRNPDFTFGTQEPYQIVVTPEKSVQLFRRDRVSDKELRRLIARRLYNSFATTTLLNSVTFDQIYLLMTGCQLPDFIRNLELLDDEGYLQITGRSPPSARPRAKLIRDVERFGAARDDAITKFDYREGLEAYEVLAEHRTELLLERQRYDAAQTVTELESVFRATAPVVEAVLRSLLKKIHPDREFTSLGKMIAILERDKVGDLGLWSQLNHILAFSRDIEEHGHQLPEPVVRIACENAFGLAIQLAALFPNT